MLWTAVRNAFDVSAIRDMLSSFLHSLVPHSDDGGEEHQRGGGGPGHGEAVVRINFWFFLLWYYAFYNLIGLLWITKLFNLYSVNWYCSFLPWRMTELTMYKIGGLVDSDFPRRSPSSTSSLSSSPSQYTTSFHHHY